MADQTFQLVVRKGPRPGQIILLAEDVITIGRDPVSDIVLNDPEVSRHHARLTLGESGYHLQDLASTNGSFVDGERLGGEPVALKPGQVIIFGSNVTLVYQSSPESDPLATVVAPLSMPLEEEEEKVPAPPVDEVAAPEELEEEEVFAFTAEGEEIREISEEPGAVEEAEELEMAVEVEEPEFVEEFDAMEEEDELATIIEEPVLEDEPQSEPIVPEPESFPSFDAADAEPVSSIDEPVEDIPSPLGDEGTEQEMAYVEPQPVYDFDATMPDVTPQPVSTPPPAVAQEPPGEAGIGGVSRNVIIAVVILLLLCCCCLLTAVIIYATVDQVQDFVRDTFNVLNTSPLQHAIALLPG